MSEAHDARAQTVVASLAASTDWSPDLSRLKLRNGPAAIAADLPVSDIAAGAYGALALAAAELAAARGGSAPTPLVDRRGAGLALAGNEYLTVDGAAPATWGAITGYYRTGDGRHVYLHGNFDHQRDGLLSVFGVADDRAAMAEALLGWTAAEAEDAAQTQGFCCIMHRSRAAWEAHPQCAALAAGPVVAITPGAEAAAAPLRAVTGDGPLSGLRVLDLSRIIAGPMGGRALAELGADVIRISAPDLPFVEGVVIDTGFGKRNAYADLRTADGRATLAALAQEAEVVIDGFRPGALAAKGFDVGDLRRLNPDLVVVELSAFSDVGPWAGRRGYDTYVQAATGFAAIGPDGAPRRLACQPLDYLTGCFVAFAAIRLLIRRAAGGGGGSAELSLARTAIWLWEMADALGPETASPARNATRDDVEAEGRLRRMESAFGVLSALAPPYGFEERPARWDRPSGRLGADPARWSG